MGILSRLGKTKYVCQKSEETKTKTFVKEFRTIEVVFSSGRTKFFTDVVLDNNYDILYIDELDEITFRTVMPYHHFEQKDGNVSNIKRETTEEKIRCDWNMSTIDEINLDYVEEVIHHGSSVKRAAHTADVVKYEWVEK